MNKTQKKTAIKKHVKDMLKENQKYMLEKLDKALNSGCIDIENWDSENAPMLVPKAIICALLEDATFQYAPHKTFSMYRQWNKEKKNISHFI